MTQTSTARRHPENDRSSAERAAETLVVVDGARPARPVLELTGEKTPVRVLLSDLWTHRALLPMLARKDFHSRYRSASLGVVWSVVLPSFQGALLAVVFTRFVKVPVTTGTSYPVFILGAMFTWSYFAQSLGAGSTAIVDMGSIVGKVYFPRLIVPAVPAAANLVGYSVSTGVLVLLMIGFGVPFRIGILLLPVAMALTATLAVLFSQLVAVLHVYFRDMRYLVQVSLLTGLYATPVIYPLERARDLRALLIANPMTGPVQLVRQAVFGEAASLAASIAASLAWTIGLLVVILLTYRRHERVAVDRL